MSVIVGASKRHVARGRLALHRILEAVDAGLDDAIDVVGAAVVEWRHQPELGQRLGEEPPCVLDGALLHVCFVDHAVVPVPQYLIDKKLPGGYVFLTEPMLVLKKEVSLKYGKDLILDQKNLNIYLNHPLMDSLKLDRNEVAEFIASKVAEWENVKVAFTANELLNTGTDNEWKDMVRKGYHSKESGDVLFLLEPGYLPKTVDSDLARKGTSHGSAFNYDTHVPLIWYGKNIPKQEIVRRINITDISATLTHLLYLQRNGAMTGEPIVELLNR